MPYIQARLSVALDETQKTNLQSKLTEVVGEAFSKPKTYIMTEVADGCSLYMAGDKVDKGAYIAVSLLGSASKDRCNFVTQKVCDILGSEYGLDGSKVYITFHPESLWGWNGMMF
ncbi:MAG: hypothetical protein K6E29_04345 [Cyanobacteria bacterium RUI128]|nr:hypothetical protein [Cyanobacteria bacterium RUI128]